MPTYDYNCLECGKDFEVFQSMKDEPLKVCTCGKKGKVQRKIGRGAGVIFKGSGFYETDYKRSGSTETKSTESTSTPAPAKTETKPPASPPPSGSK